MPGDAVREGLAIFATVLLSIGALAAAATVCWLLLFHLALKKLPPVQEALGLKKRDKPTLAEMRHEIDALKAHHQAAQSGDGAGSQPTLSPAGRGVRVRR
ncbi:general secretion pathway [Micractinium conductrix]|uniref:General secretion pathway n=1 Tax=Micractinium conductrix TaxID=554055 RepID=A0A2P6VID4_9CHLO|nr:general secretion pathway [Micractinium conductrix]|eukprot:PSC73838.1 general secretion pathway [Micractinium conductrix]